MTATSTVTQGVTAVVSNQQRTQDRLADHALLEEAIGHLRHQVQHAVSSGWSADTTDDGRHLIVGGSGPFQEVLAETHGDWAQPVREYLLTVQPRHALSLLALLETLSREISTGDASRATRNATLKLAESLLGDGHRTRSVRRPGS